MTYLRDRAGSFNLLRNHSEKPGTLKGLQKGQFYFHLPQVNLPSLKMGECYSGPIPVLQSTYTIRKRPHYTKTSNATSPPHSHPDNEYRAQDHAMSITCGQGQSQQQDPRRAWGLLRPLAAKEEDVMESGDLLGDHLSKGHSPTPEL